MDVNYARLCCRYVAASALLRGRVVPEDFRPAALRDPDILELARRVDVIVDGNPDPNALVPVTVEVNLRDGRSDTERVDVMYGNPARPMARVAQLEKFSRNCAAAARPIAPEAAERIIATVARLESLSDVTALVDDLVPAPTTHPPDRIAPRLMGGHFRARVLPVINPTSPCAVRRRRPSAGGNPARQLSLQPVAVGAGEGGNDDV